MGQEKQQKKAPVRTAERALFDAGEALKEAALVEGHRRSHALATAGAALVEAAVLADPELRRTLEAEREPAKTPAVE